MVHEREQEQRQDAETKQGTLRKQERMLLRSKLTVT